MSERRQPPRKAPLGRRDASARKDSRLGARPLAGALLDARLPRLVELWRAARDHRRVESKARLARSEIEAASAALLDLQRGLTGDRTLPGSGYMDDGDLLGAYLLYYWPVSYMQVSVALAERPFSPRRILDLGSGPGPASAAIIDAAAPGSRLDLVSLVDSSAKALELAETILSQGPNAPARLETMRLDLESGGQLPDGPFDLIVSGHCLNELWRGEADALGRRRDLVERAAERLAPGGIVLLVEPALLSTCRDLIAVRDGLAANGWRVLGPCPGSYACPAFAAGPDRSCHSDAPWAPPETVASLAQAAGLDRSSVKFAYFFLAPSSARPEASTELRRVVSEPMLNKAGRLRYVLCGDSRLDTISARADDVQARDKGFMDLRRGDTLRPRGLETRPGGSAGVLPGSELGLDTLAAEASS